ncbi:MAG: adenylyl cyclase, partial [Proteobacteria bacterium]|nr:adenylyl cyclase [Pseudomonadota bacterium]
MSFIAELKRRNVIRVGFAYAVVAWVVAQVADLALESFGSPPWVMKTILFLMAIGWVIAIFIAWAYEITPDGIKREADVNRADSIGQQTGRKLDRLVIVVLLLAVAVLLLERFLPTHDQALIDNPAPRPATQLVTPAPQATPGTTADKARDTSAGLSIAVLPFVNMSSDPEQEFFSDGISEEILNVLSRIQSLKVAARTSSFQFKGKNLDIEDIGRQLQVNHLLEGSVRKSGSTLRITAQLIEADTGFHVWSETFDRNPEDIFAIQDEIAAAIAVKLRALVSGEVATSTPVDLQAYEL